MSSKLSLGIGLEDLTLDNIGSWPLFLHVLCVGLTLALILFSSYALYFKYQFQLLESVRKEETGLRQEFETKQSQAANLEAYKLQLVEVKNIFNKLLRKLPSESEVPGLLEDISKLGVTNGLEFRLFDPQDEIEHEFYVELPIQMSVHGDYRQLGSFISDISSLDRIVTVHQVLIKPVEVKSQPADKTLTKNITSPVANGFLQMDITAKTYRYREEPKVNKDDTKQKQT